MLKFTSFVGNDSIAVAEAFLPSSSANELQPQTSLGNSLVRAITGGVSDSNEHFVVTPLYFEPVDGRVAPLLRQEFKQLLYVFFDHQLVKF